MNWDGKNENMLSPMDLITLTVVIVTVGIFSIALALGKIAINVYIYQFLPLAFQFLFSVIIPIFFFVRKPSAIKVTFETLPCFN